MGEWDGLESRLKDLGEEAARLVDDPLDRRGSAESRTAGACGGRWRRS